MAKSLVALLVWTMLVSRAFATFTVEGPQSLPALKSYVENMSIRRNGSICNRDELDIIKAKIATGQEPWTTALAILKTSTLSQPTYTPTASALIDGSGNATKELADANAAYTQALLWYLTGETAYAQKSAEIIDAWSSTLQSHIGNSNWYLTAAWAGSLFSNAAELLRTTYPAWPQSSIQQCQAMFNRAFLPILHQRKAYGNRELSVCNALLGIGIFNGDRAAIYEALHHWISYVPCYIYLSSDGVKPIKADYWLTEPSAAQYQQMHADLFPTPNDPNDWVNAPAYPATNRGDDKTMMTIYTVEQQWYMAAPTSTFSNPVPAYVDGLCAETFRDMGHAEFAFAAMINVAEMAWHQGIDLYSAHAPRMAAMMEFHAALRLSQPAPAALSQSGVISSGNGLNPTYEIAYNHLHNTLGYELPNTETLIQTAVRAAKAVRIKPPSGIFASGIWPTSYYHISWETLTHANLPARRMLPQNGLVAYYSCEQSTTDLSASGNDGVAKAGFAFSSDATEGAYSGQFDGNGGRVVVPDSGSLRITGDLTLATWVKLNAVTTKPNLIAKSFNTGYRLRINETGALCLLLGKGTSSPSQIIGTASVPTGIWTHVAATVRFTNGTAFIQFYINGAPDGTAKTAALTAIQAGTDPLVLGARNDATSSTESLNGHLDQITIYNRALSSDEIWLLAQ